MLALGRLVAPRPDFRRVLTPRGHAAGPLQLKLLGPGLFGGDESGWQQVLDGPGLGGPADGGGGRPRGRELFALLLEGREGRAENAVVALGMGSTVQGRL